MFSIQNSQFLRCDFHCTTSQFAGRVQADTYVLPNSCWRASAISTDRLRAVSTVQNHPTLGLVRTSVLRYRQEPGKLQRWGKTAMHLSVSGDAEGIHALRMPRLGIASMATKPYL